MAFLSTLSSMALQVSGVDATTQQGPAQNDGYEPYGTVWVMPTLYRLHGNAGMTPQVYKFYGTGVVLLECRHNSTSSMAPQECPTILQVLWHRKNAATIPQVLWHRRSVATILQVLWHYGGAGSARETTGEGGIKGDH